ncbi:MAG: TolC family protein [Endomicrobia bacterium]|nr:TolC family protein [Endomicrobiia bacterium]
MKVISILLSILLLSNNCFAEKIKEITLNECVDTAIQSSNYLKIKLYEISNLKLEIKRANAIFEPYLWSNVMLNNINTPADSTLDGVDILKITDLYADVGLTKQLITGTQVDFVFNNFYENTNIVNQVMNPLYKNSIGFNIRQPVLSGAKVAVITQTIETAKINLKIANDEYEDLKNQIENDVKKAYFELNYTYYGYRLSQETLSAIKEIENNSLAKLKAGEISGIDVLKVKEKVSEEQASCIDMKRQCIEAEFILKKLMNINYDDENYNTKLIPQDKYETYINKYDFEYVRKKGLTHNYEYIKQLKEIEKREITLKVAKATNMPILNAIAGAKINGMERNLFDSYAQTAKADHYTWQIGIELAVPVGNKDKQNTYEQAKNELHKEKIKLSDLEKDYYSDVALKINRLEFLNNQVEALIQTVSLANKRFDAVKEKFKRGMVSNNDILETLYEMKDIKEKLNKAIFENNLTAIEIERLIGE